MTEKVRSFLSRRLLWKNNPSGCEKFINNEAWQEKILVRLFSFLYNEYSMGLLVAG